MHSLDRLQRKAIIAFVFTAHAHGRHFAKTKSCNKKGCDNESYNNEKCNNESYY